MVAGGAPEVSEDGLGLLGPAVPEQVPQEDEAVAVAEPAAAYGGDERGEVAGRGGGAEFPFGLGEACPDGQPVLLVGA